MTTGHVLVGLMYLSQKIFTTAAEHRMLITLLIQTLTWCFLPRALPSCQSSPALPVLVPLMFDLQFSGVQSSSQQLRAQALSSPARGRELCQQHPELPRLGTVTPALLHPPVPRTAPLQSSVFTSGSPTKAPTFFKSR